MKNDFFENFIGNRLSSMAQVYGGKARSTRWTQTVHHADCDDTTSGSDSKECGVVTYGPCDTNC